MNMKGLKIAIAINILFAPLAIQGYDPLAGVRGDVSKILNPQTSDAELDAIAAKHRQWTQIHQGGVTSQQMWNRANSAQMQQQDRKSAFQYQQNANYWDTQERAARDVGNNWAAETARRNAEYNRQKAKEYGWR